MHVSPEVSQLMKDFMMYEILRTAPSPAMQRILDAGWNADDLCLHSNTQNAVYIVSTLAGALDHMVGDHRSEPAARLTLACAEFCDAVHDPLLVADKLIATDNSKANEYTTAMHEAAIKMRNVAQKLLDQLAAQRERARDLA